MPVSFSLQANYAGEGIPRLLHSAIRRTSTSYAAIKKEHVSLIFKLKRLFLETELAASESKQWRMSGQTFFWVLGGIPTPESKRPFEYYIIPSDIIAKNVSEAHKLWLSTPGRRGQAHADNTVRIVHLPPRKSPTGWDISRYRDRWDLIEEVLHPKQSNAAEMQQDS